MLLSVAIIAHNEEKNIIRALQSVYQWVNEIVLIDAQSTDATVKLTTAFDQHKKIRIFHEDNPPNFILNKQKAIDRCRGTWILELDADEIVSKELKEEILIVINPKSEARNAKQIQNSKLDVIAYRIPRLNYFLGRPLKKGGQYPNYVIRLYQKACACFPGKTIHDQVDISPEVKVERLKTPLLHYPYPSFEMYIKKWLQYSVFEAQELAKKKPLPSFGLFFKYMIFLPTTWFLKTYVRHKGFQDGLPGFIFSLFSAIRYWVIYIKLYEINRRQAIKSKGER